MVSILYSMIAYGLSFGKRKVEFKGKKVSFAENADNMRWSLWSKNWVKILSCMYFPLKVSFCISADQPFQFPEVAKKFVTAMLSSHGGAWPHILDLCSIMAYSLSLKSPFASQSYLLYSHPLTNMPPKCGMPEDCRLGSLTGTHSIWCWLLNITKHVILR